MVRTVRAMLPALCVVLCLTYVTGSTIEFTSTPSTINPLVTDDLTLKCSLRDAVPSDNSSVHSILIHKGGVAVAMVSEQNVVFDNTTDVQVTGQVSGSGDVKGCLQVSWKYPGSDQAGAYHCVITAADQRGHDHYLIQTLDVGESDVSLIDVVRYLHQLKLTYKLQTAGLNSTNADMKTKVVMFTAILTSTTNISYSQVVVFNKMQTSIGGGYNNSTGVFTCPVSGYYVFHVHFATQDNKNAWVCLTHNNNTCVTAAYGTGGLDNQSASTSASLQLQRGDTVKVISQRPSYLYGDSYGDTSFTGHLVAVA